MSGGIDIGYDDHYDYVMKAQLQKTIDEIDEMVNNGVVDKDEACRLKDQLMEGRKNCLS